MRLFTTILGIGPINIEVMCDLFEKKTLKDGVWLVTLNLLIAIGYIILAYLGLSLADIQEQVTAVWPASGFAVGMTLLYGWAVLPGIFLGALLANYVITPDLVLSSFIGLGNTTESALIYLLYIQIRENADYFSMKNLLALFLATIAGASVSAANGASALVILNGVSPLLGLSIGVQWWLGDLIGIFVVTPFVLAIKHLRLGWLFGAHVGLTVIVSAVIFVLSDLSLAYLIVAPILLFGSRFRYIGEATAILLAAIASTIGSANGFGPFGDEPILSLQLFLGSTSIFTLLYFAGRREWNL